MDAEIVSVPARPARHTVRPPSAPRAAPDAAPPGGLDQAPRELCYHRLLALRMRRPSWVTAEGEARSPLLPRLASPVL